MCTSLSGHDVVAEGLRLIDFYICWKWHAEALASWDGASALWFEVAYCRGPNNLQHIGPVILVQL